MFQSALIREIRANKSAFQTIAQRFNAHRFSIVTK
jgi:hypothetical protein